MKMERATLIDQLLIDFDKQLQAALLNDLITHRWNEFKKTALATGSNQDNDLLVA